VRVDGCDPSSEMAVSVSGDDQRTRCSRSSLFMPEKQDWPERHSFSRTESEGLMQENDPGPMKRLHAFVPQQAPQGL